MRNFSWYGLLETNTDQQKVFIRTRHLWEWCHYVFSPSSFFLLLSFKIQHSLVHWSSAEMLKLLWSVLTIQTPDQIQDWAFTKDSFKQRLLKILAAMSSISLGEANIRMRKCSYWHMGLGQCFQEGYGSISPSPEENNKNEGRFKPHKLWGKIKRMAWLFSL